MHLPVRSISVVAAGLFLTSLILGALGVFALPAPVSDFLSSVTGVKESVLKEVVDPISKKIPLVLLPSGHGSGLDADTLDGQHASSFALATELEAVRSDLLIGLGALPTPSPVNLSGYLAKTGTAADSAKLGGNLPSYYQNAANLGSGTLSDARLSGNVALLDLAQTITALKTFSGGISVSGGQVTLPPASISDAALSANVALLSGSQTFTGSKSFAALLTAQNGFTLNSGALTLPGNSILDAALSANVALLTGSQTFSGAKTFSSALTAPTAGDSINGLVVSSGNATLANLTSSTGSLTSTVADSGTGVGFVLGTQASYSSAGAKLLSVRNGASEKLFLDKDGLLTVNGNIVATGTVQGTQLISTIATGTAPLVVSSTTQVANLNANFVQGFQASDLYGAPQPNLIPNSDFSRRTKWMTFMPEVFADTAGWTAQTGVLGTVAGNILTAGTAGAAWRATAAPGMVWRDGRWSAQFKMVNAGLQEYGVDKWVNATDRVSALEYNGQLILQKTIAGVATNIVVIAQAVTLNNWYWLELEAQGTTYIAKLYSSGAAPVAKSASTLLQTAVGTVADASVVAGTVAISSTVGTLASQWGGLATGDGGVYVEGWGPESTDVFFDGTKGGQAIGFDETSDVGPIGKQWAMRAYIPAASRAISVRNVLPNGGLAPSNAYTASFYEKVSGVGGSGTLIRQAINQYNASGTFISTPANSQGVTTDTSWTRKTATFTTDPAARQAYNYILINEDQTGAVTTATGTAFFDLTQLEQGGVATPWRNAPEDFGPLVWELQAADTEPSTVDSTTSLADVNPRDYAANIFLPWDAKVRAEIQFLMHGSAAGASGYYVVYGFDIDGGRFRQSRESTIIKPPVGGVSTENTVHVRDEVGAAAGKHRISFRHRHATITGTFYQKGNGVAAHPQLIIMATKGK